MYSVSTETGSYPSHIYKLQPRHDIYVENLITLLLYLPIGHSVIT
jgi:hypothetical protein